MSIVPALLCMTLSCQAAPLPPNVVFILIDDMGYGDLSCTGNDLAETPHLDRLAQEGIRFSRFYVGSPICSPSRVAFTTGQYPARHLINSYLNTRQRNRERGMADYLDPNVPTVARTFKQAGYATAHFGKWHMGGGRDVDDAPLPQAYGFDESLVSFEGLGDRILQPEDHRLSKQSAVLGHGNIAWVPKHENTGIYVDRTIDFVTHHRSQPFYVHLWLNDVHDPFKPSEEHLARYAIETDNPKVRKFIAVLCEMDRQIGRLVTAIDELELDERTMIIVTSDNGPTAWPRYYNQGIDPPGSTGGDRGRKWSLYEGGIRMPLIVRWPGSIDAGLVDDTTVITAVDYFQTVCRIAGIAPPDVDFDGEDMSASWLGRPQKRGRPVFWEYGRTPDYLRPGLEYDRSPSLAMRDGDWKFLVNVDGSRPELYNLQADPRESENLVNSDTERAAAMQQQQHGWWQSLPQLDR
jgi:arylsulfatase A-like enzyme